MRGDEIRIVDAFCFWLEGQGWAIQREVEFVDVLAEKDGERLGHSTVAFTMDVHSHAIPSMEAEAAETIANPVRGSGQ